jgi:hypothetical protein
MQRSKVFALITASLVLTACQVPAVSTQVPTFALQPAPRIQGAATAPEATSADLQGTVHAPAGYTEGGNVYGLQQLAERPLAHAQVVLADVAGNPVPGVKPVMTDAQGKFRFERVPAGITYVVQAVARKGGKVAHIKGLAEAGAAPVALDAATTLATSDVLKARPAQRVPQRMDLAEFQGLARKMAEVIAQEAAVIDLTDEAKLQQLAAEARRKLHAQEALDALEAKKKERQAQHELEIQAKREREAALTRKMPPVELPAVLPTSPEADRCALAFRKYSGGDGFIDLDDARLLGWSLEMFKKYDRNGDGRVDAREFRWAMCGEAPVVKPAEPEIKPVRDIEKDAQAPVAGLDPLESETKPVRDIDVPKMDEAGSLAETTTRSND